MSILEWYLRKFRIYNGDPKKVTDPWEKFCENEVIQAEDCPEQRKGFKNLIL